MQGQKTKSTEFLFTGICIFTALLSIIVRLRYVDIPFERDEGEYAYAGQAILKGLMPYVEMYNMKFPGTYLMYALFMLVFGHSLVAIRVGVLLLHFVQYFFIYKSTKTLFNTRAGWLAVAVLSLMNISMNAQAINTNAEHFVITFLIAGFYFLIKSIRQPSITNYFLTGMLLSIAIVMKQHAFYFFPIAIIVAAVGFYRNRDWKAPVGLVVGSALPMVVMFLWLWHGGALASFKFWCFDYSRQYAPIGLLDARWFNFLAPAVNISEEFPQMVFPFLLAAPALLFSRHQWATKLLLLGILMASMLAISPGFYFRQHYFILLFPITAILLAYFFDVVLTWMEKLSVWVAAAALAILFLSYFPINYRYCFVWSNRQTLDHVYFGSDNFFVSKAMGYHIKSITSENERITNVTNEPELFFYSERLSASPYMYVYPMNETHPYVAAMVKEDIDKIVAAHTNILVVPSENLWFTNNYGDIHLKAFCVDYAKDFDLVGVSLTRVNNNGVHIDQTYVHAGKDSILDLDKIDHSLGEPTIKVYKRKGT